MPTMKKRGRTVFGVKIGLLPCGQYCCFTAHTLDVHILPCLQSLLSKCSVCSSVNIASLYAQLHSGLLGGRLLFVFLVFSRLGSWLDIESLGSICCVCDMLSKSALFRSDERRCKSCSRRALTTLLADSRTKCYNSPSPVPKLATDTDLTSPRSPLTQTHTQRFKMHTIQGSSNCENTHSTGVARYSSVQMTACRMIESSQRDNRNCYLILSSGRSSPQTDYNTCRGGGYRMMQTKETDGSIQQTPE